MIDVLVPRICPGNSKRYIVCGDQTITVVMPRALGPRLGLFLVWVKGNYLIVSKPSPQEEVLLSASHDKTVRIWDLRARGKGPIQVLTGAVDSVLCLMTHGDVPWLGRLEGWEIALY